MNWRNLEHFIFDQFRLRRQNVLFLYELPVYIGQGLIENNNKEKLQITSPLLGTTDL